MRTYVIQCTMGMWHLLLGVGSVFAASNDTFNFLAMGDWGNDSPGQHACGAGMGVVAADIDAKFVFALGDNCKAPMSSTTLAAAPPPQALTPLAPRTCPPPPPRIPAVYPNGIQMPADGDAAHLRFNKTFENVYTAPSLRNVPFYAIAGNHDHNGNVTAQMQYTDHPQNVGGRWQFPNWYHNVTRRFEVGGATVELEVLLFDSVVMLGNTDVQRADGAFEELKLSALPPRDTTLAAEQLAWLTGRLQTSTADYLWVGGHYPVWAIGQDPPTGVNAILRDLLNEHGAQYFNGHEHDFEHLREEGSNVNYICTGAGYFCCYEDKNLDTVPQGSIRFATSGNGGAKWYGGVEPPPFEILSGFTSYRVGANSMKVVFHAHNGTVLYETPPILPRIKTPQPPAAPPNPVCDNTTCPHTDRGGFTF